MAAEARLTAACVRELTKMKRAGEPVEWLKVHGSGMQRRGEPDLSITYHGRSVKAELKAPRGRPTKLQEYRMDQWRRAGAIVGTVHTVEDLRGLLEQCHAARDES